MNWSEVLAQVMLNGGPSTCQFALTNRCNAKCEFCNFSRDKADRQTWRSADFAQAREALGILCRNGVRFVIFTGGEPLLYDGLQQLMLDCRQLGMEPIVVTNAGCLTEQMTENLLASGLQSIIISVDATTPEVHESNRGLPGVWAKIKKANAILAKAGRSSVASMTLSHILGPLDRIPGVLKELGFDAVTFSFPLTSLKSNYLGFADNELVDYSVEEMHQLIDQVIALKRQCAVMNPTASLVDMHAHLDDKPEMFECYGGFKQFYLDWDLLLWRCNNWKKPMCHISQFDGSQMVRDGCTRCIVDCYRDASVLQHCAVSLSDSLHSLFCMRADRTVKQLFNRPNLVSIQAVLENSLWIKSL